ncbi:Psf2-domain-containing protein [Dacryopinax primogenitus]|uniref:DNA replication complex GINS protein PSF2 n=1 Tax=Dacryopinax primogenitus (strain DJM 731) TaxID=1858805 RepID=M5GAY8_DACPD|nr:Psf2-domain-containing protein [Dacryopinax primogenitus]EJU01108.1 Psf2-domain-containing protein [Dacryopinax primogenitus]
MALPARLMLSPLPEELEFIALQQTDILVRPHFTMGKIRLLSGSYGPFRATANIELPLWVGKYLKQQGKCALVPPSWLNPDWLEEKLKQEMSKPEEFAPLPFRYAEIAKVFLDIAPEDVPSPERVRSLLKDIREVRQAKTRKGLALVDETELRMTGLGSMEINELRPFLIRAMGVMRVLASVPEVPGTQDNSFAAGESGSRMEEDW